LGDLVVVPYPQRAVAHIAGIIMAAEREVVPGFQPAVIGGTEFCKWSEFDHGIFPWFELIQRVRHAPV